MNRSLAPGLLMILLFVPVILLGVFSRLSFFTSESTDPEATTWQVITEKLEQARPFRRWTDNTGDFTTVAKVTKKDGGSVELEKLSGTVVTVHRSRLSEKDLQYLDSLDQVKQQGENFLIPEALMEQLSRFLTVDPEEFDKVGEEDYQEPEAVSESPSSDGSRKAEREEGLRISPVESQSLR